MANNPWDLPTAGDYAWAAAQDAQRDNKSLEERVLSLERTVEDLAKLVGKLVREREDHPGGSAGFP